MITTFETLLDNARKSNVIITNGRQSLKWLSTEAKKLSKITYSSLVREEGAEFVNRNQITVGRMYLFQYDPKLKDKLPYYDSTPLIFPIGPAKGGFLGINLHYIPYALRAKLMDALYTIENEARYTRNKKLQINYGILKSTAGMEAFKPCLKHYLFKHVRSKLMKIEYENWGSAAFLPSVAEWNKASQAKVWADSRKKMRR